MTVSPVEAVNGPPQTLVASRRLVPVGVSVVMRDAREGANARLDVAGAGAAETSAAVPRASRAAVATAAATAAARIAVRFVKAGPPPRQYDMTS